MGVTEDPEKRFERVMQRLLYDKASTSPPTPAGSSAGASSPANGIVMGDPHTMAQVSSGGLSTRPPRAAVSTSTAGASIPNSSVPTCRPWDRGDLLKRLATFKSITWFGKPQIAGPVACARRGWVNVDVDLLACEGCSARLSLSIPPTWSRTQVESAAEAFAEQLDKGHKSLCPWKGNACADTLAQFPPTPLPALVEAYNDRCESLIQLSALPIIANSAIDKIRGASARQLDRLLSQPPPLLPGGQPFLDNAGADSGGESAVLHPFYQSQRIISLCGWEPRLLPYTVDCEERSAPAAQGEGVSRTPRDAGPSVLLHKKSATTDPRKERDLATKGSLQQGDPASAVLDCSLCGASVGLWSFATAFRPAPLVGSILVEPVESRGNFPQAPVCGASAMSGIEGREAGSKQEPRNKEQAGKPDGLAEARTSAEPFIPSTGRALNLNLTIAGGPPPTQLSSPGMVPPVFGPIPGIQPRSGQPESSEMGEWVASVESREPRDNERGGVGQGGSTLDASQSRQIQADSVEGTVVDHEGDEVDDGEVGRCRVQLRQSSKRKRKGESSAVDQVSQGVVGTGPHSTTEVRGKSRGKRHCKDGNTQGFTGDRSFPWPGARDLPRSSSVNAIDTCYQNKQENSMESVDNLHQDSDGQGTAVSVENNDCDGQVDHRSSVLQAQQSMSRSRRSSDNAEPDSSKSDEGGGEEAGDTNAAAVSAGTGTGTGGAISVGMGGGSVGIGASQEAEIHGEVYGADASVHRTDSMAGDGGFVTEVTENQGLMGDFTPDEADKVRHKDVQGDSHEAIHSPFTGGAGQAVADGEFGENGGEKDSQGEGDEQTEIEGTRDTTMAVILDSDGPEKEVTDGSIEAANVEDKLAGRPSEDVRIWDTKAEEFDPVRQHRHFCPWVNGQVAAAGSSSSRAVCGWQLTVNALDALQHQEQAPGGMTESESTASMYKGDPLASVRKLLGKKSSLERQSSRVNS